MVRSVALRVLGGFEVVVDGVGVGLSWPSRRPAELVQLLAISPEHRLIRDEVIEALWPHLTADAGAANLRKAAHLARRVVRDEHAIVLRHQQVLLFPNATITCDLEAFRAAAESALASADPGAAARAADLYGGELLPTARYDDWSADARHRASNLYLDLLRLSGRWDAVIELDPTDEPATQASMRAALAAGQRHRAIGAYGRLRQALREQLGVTPATETEQLYADSRAGVATLKQSIIGRHRELAIVDDVLAETDAQPHLLVVRGAAGIGKTTLLDALADRARGQGRLVVRSIADDPDDAYAVLASVFERIVEGRGDLVDQLDPRSRAVLATVIVLPGEIHELDVPPTRHQMLGVAQRLVGAVAARSGVTLIVDDVDRADQASLEVLALLGDRSIGRVLVAIAHREPHANTNLDRALARAARVRPPTVLPLDPLSNDDAVALVRSVMPDVDSPTSSEIVGRGDGVPLFLVELAATAGSSGAGDAVRRAIEARMVDLDVHEVAWLRRLAITGGALDLGSVLAVAGCTDSEANQLLDRALDAGVLVVDDGSYRFRHELVRSTLADQLPPHQQAAVHRDAARRLAELGARPGRIAAHWRSGNRPAEAADWFSRAAEQAMRLGGYAAAVDELDQALSLVAEHPTALQLRARALDALGDPAALAAYDAAIAVAAPHEVHELRPLQALAQVKGGDPHGAVITIAGAEPRSLESQVAHALTLSGAALLGAIGPEAGTRLSADARQKALRAGDPAALVVAAWSQAAISHARGELRESLWADLADTRALPRLALTVFDGQLCITQRLLYGNRPYDDVIRFTDAFAAEAQRIGAARAVAFAVTLRGEAELLNGRLDDAERDLREGVRLHRAMAAATGEAFSLQRLAELAHVRGDDDMARRLLDEALDVTRLSDVGFHLLDRVYGTRIQLARDPIEALDLVVEAETAVRGPFETCPGCRITLDVPAAIASAEAGDVERLDHYERTCTFLAEVVMRLPAWDAALDEVRGHHRRVHGDLDGAIDHFRRAAATFDTVGQPYDADRCRRRVAALTR